MTDYTTFTSTELLAALDRINDRLARIVASVHGVVPLAMNNTREAIEDELQRRKTARRPLLINAGWCNPYGGDYDDA